MNRISFTVRCASHTLLLLLSVVLETQAQWVHQPFPSAEYLWKVRFVDTLTGWVLGQSHIYKTSDGGNSWMPQDSVIGGGDVLTALNRDTVFWANFTGVPPYTRGLRRTTNGGLTWSTVDTLPLYWTELKFVGDNVGYAVGGTTPDFNPIVRKTTDGGASWTTNWIGSGGSELEGVSFVDAQRGWIISYYRGLVYRTTDGGTNWVLQDSTGHGYGDGWVPMRDICFVTADSGWAVGGISGLPAIARTTNGGTSWTYVRPPIGSSFREVAMRNSRLGWCAGMNNDIRHIARTTDGGETWSAQDFSPAASAGFESISMITDRVGWAVGPSGVYKTVNGGIVSVPYDESVPHGFTLDQNYPNPFNPTTKITYSIPSRSSVKLSVCNILGQEVMTLVNEQQEAGGHEARFDGSNLASGVYIYRLTSGQNVFTRKMILMK
jgi:photosystem II stability/assembly factor-like uncharacterized protein